MTTTTQKHTLSVDITNFGKFYKAKLDGQILTKEQLYTLIGINDLAGFSLEKYVSDFEESNIETFDVEIWPMDVS